MELLARTFLATVFILAGVYKLLAPVEAFERTQKHAVLNTLPLNPLAIWCVGWCECLIGGFVGLGKLGILPSVAAMMMSIGFMGVLLLSPRGATNEDCGCFPPGLTDDVNGRRAASFRWIVRFVLNVLLIGASIIVSVAEIRVPRQGVAIAPNLSVVVIVSLFALAGMLSLRVNRLTRNGRGILRRMREVISQ